MSDPRVPDAEVNRVLRTWLHEDRHEDADRVLSSALDQAATTPQRRTTSWFARRTPVMNKFVAIGLGVAAVVVALIIGSNLLGSPAPGGEPSPSVAPSQVATASPAAVRHRFTFIGSGVTASAAVPANWNPQSWFAMLGTTAPPDGMTVTFEAISNTFADPCGHVLRSPVIGSTTADLVTALGELPNHTATEPTDDTIGGLPATYLELTADDSFPCAPDEFFMWTDDPTGEVPGTGLYAQGVSQILRMWVLEVSGERVTVFAMRYPTSTDEGIAEQQAILDSIQFE